MAVKGPQPSPLNVLVAKLAPGAAFDNGFVKGRTVEPYYNAAGTGQDAGWSDEIAEDLEEHSQNHFIDIYNRRLAVTALEKTLRVDGSAFLDAGCSSGYLLADVRRRFPHCSVIGADYFAAGLRHCHAAQPNVPLFRMDLTGCPFPDQTFDGVACLNVLEHIKRDDLALHHLYRILKPGGVAAITVPAGPGLFDLYDELHFHERRYALRPLRKQIQKAGFTIQSANYFGSFIYPAFYFVKKRNQRKYAGMTLDQKRQLMMGQIRSTSRSRLMDFVCRIEEVAGHLLPYPAGIRIYAVAQKPL